MKELELEAEQYAEIQLKDMTDKSSKFECVNDFIAGVTSKFVEIQKLEFAIEQLKSISLGLSDANTVTVYNLLQKIKELEQILKEYDSEKEFKII